MAESKRATVNDRNSWSIFKQEFHKAYDLYGEISDNARALTGLAVRFVRLAGYMEQVRAAVYDGTANAPEPADLSIIQCRALSMKGVYLTDGQNDALQAIAACCEDLANAGNVKTKSGRPVAEFKDCIADRYKKDTTRIIDNIRKELEGKRGKNAARVIAAAINLGYIDQTKLQCAMICNEFGKVVIKNSFKGYLIEPDEKRRVEIFDCHETKEIECRLKKWMTAI